MAFTALTVAEVSPKEPVKGELMDKIRTNFDDHETRLNTLETANVLATPFLFRVEQAAIGTGKRQFIRVHDDITITKLTMFTIEAGSGAGSSTQVEFFFYDVSIASYTSMGTLTANNNSAAFNDATPLTISQNVDEGDLVAIEVNTQNANHVNFTMNMEYFAR